MTPSVEERLAYLEGKVEEHSRGFGEIRELLVHLNGRVDAMDQKVDSRIHALDQKVDRFRQDVSRQFNWLVGIQVAILLSIIGALVGG